MYGEAVEGAEESLVPRFLLPPDMVVAVVDPEILPCGQLYRLLKSMQATSPPSLGDTA